MKIIFDHKIFWNQKFGGISRYFVNLIKKLNEEENIDYKVISPFYKNNYLNEIDKKKEIERNILFKKADDHAKIDKERKKSVLSYGKILLEKIQNLQTNCC